MKAETKVKWKRRGRKVVNFLKDWGLPIFGVATVGAAWSGHSKSIKLEQELARTQEIVDNNAMVQRKDRSKLLELEHQQTVLFERALRLTEGGEPK